jgi:type I restriction enzyme, S subunit
MAGEWREVAVDEIKAQSENALATGPFGSSIGSRFFTDSGVPMIRGTNLSEEVGTRLSDQGLVFLSPTKARDFSRSTVHAGDLVFTCWGTVNQIGLIDRRAAHREYIISNKQMKLTPDPAKADSLFLYYLFSGPELQHRIKSQSIGSSVPGFNLGQLRAMRIRIPSVDKQRAIAHILGTLDDRIELNRRMSETLEAMARALFKSWFVDFDPVRAKMDGRWRRGESLPGLPAHLYDLFPSRLVDSDLGEIPEGWEVGTLGGVSALNPEVWTRQSRPPEIRYVDLSNTKWGQIEVVTTHQASDAPSRAQRVLRAGDTIVATVRPGNGSYALISEPGLTGSTGFAVLRPISAGYTEFLYLAATAADNIDTLAHLADGGAYPAVRPEVVAATPIVRPSDEVRERFSGVAGALVARIAQGHRESRTLAGLRDTLVPKLISGELRTGADHTGGGR